MKARVHQKSQKNPHKNVFKRTLTCLTDAYTRRKFQRHICRIKHDEYDGAASDELKKALRRGDENAKSELIAHLDSFPHVRLLRLVGEIAAEGTDMADILPSLRNAFSPSCSDRKAAREALSALVLAFSNEQNRKTAVSVLRDVFIDNPRPNPLAPLFEAMERAPMADEKIGKNLAAMLEDLSSDGNPDIRKTVVAYLCNCGLSQEYRSAESHRKIIRRFTPLFCKLYPDPDLRGEAYTFLLSAALKGVDISDLVPRLVEDYLKLRPQQDDKTSLDMEFHDVNTLLIEGGRHNTRCRDRISSEMIKALRANPASADIIKEFLDKARFSGVHFFDFQEVSESLMEE